MTERRRLVTVPATSANLGPGFDVMAAALEIGLELEVTETREFSIDPGDESLATDRSNLCVKAFESLHSADGLRFVVRSQVPLARGLGSSASAIVAGLFAADHMFELGLGKDALYEKAVEIEGHPDNVAAAVYGGFVVCPRPEDGLMPQPLRLDPPQGVEAVVVVPHDPVSTAEAREALPAEVAHGDAVENVAAAAQLALGIERSDLGLIRRGLADRLHQPWRRGLYERSMELVEAAVELGALGATISGAGPTVLVWSFWQDTGAVVSAVTDWAGGWATVERVPFSPLGADVPEL